MPRRQDPVVIHTLVQYSRYKLVLSWIIWGAEILYFPYFKGIPWNPKIGDWKIDITFVDVKESLYFSLIKHARFCGVFSLLT